MFTKGELKQLLQLHDHQGAAKLRAAFARNHLSPSHIEEDQFITTLKDILQYSFVMALEDDDTLPIFALTAIECILKRTERPLRYRDDETEKTVNRTLDLIRKSNTVVNSHKLFECVVRGEQYKAGLMAREDWLSEENRTRTFSGIIVIGKPLEYALWARDMAMCRHLSMSMSPELIAEQMLNLEERGLKDLGHRFDIRPYKQACEDYFDFVKLHRRKVLQLSPHGTELDKAIFQEGTRLFCLIGKAQLDFPVNYIHEYYRTDRSFLTKGGHMPIFDTNHLPGDNDTPRRIISFTFLEHCREVYSIYTSSSLQKGIKTLIRYDYSDEPFLSLDQTSFGDGERTLKAVRADYNAICAFNTVLEEAYELFKQSILERQLATTSACTM